VLRELVVATFLYKFYYFFLLFLKEVLSKNTVAKKALLRIHHLSSEIQAENFSAKRSDFRVIVRRFLLLVRQSETDAKRARISLVVVGTASPFGSISLDHIKIHFLKTSYCL
jgi:hypothetical protein